MLRLFGKNVNIVNPLIYLFLNIFIQSDDEKLKIADKLITLNNNSLFIDMNYFAPY